MYQSAGFVDTEGVELHLRTIPMPTCRVSSIGEEPYRNIDHLRADSRAGERKHLVAAVATLVIGNVKDGNMAVQIGRDTGCLRRPGVARTERYVAIPLNIDFGTGSTGRRRAERAVLCANFRKLVVNLVARVRRGEVAEVDGLRAVRLDVGVFVAHRRVEEGVVKVIVRGVPGEFL